MTHKAGAHAHRPLWGRGCLAALVLLAGLLHCLQHAGQLYALHGGHPALQHDEIVAKRLVQLQGIPTQCLASWL